MPQKKNWFLVANATAGRGKASNTIDNVMQALNHKGIEYEIGLTKYPKHGIELSRLASQNGYGTIVAIGGDGTINEVANGIMLSQKKVKMGIIPEGGGNDFAKMFSIPRNVHAAVNLLQHGHSHKIDVGKFNSTYFVNVLGIGLDAVVAKLAAANTNLNGLARYMWALFKALKTLDYYQLQIKTAELEETRKLLLLSIGNGQFCGGGFRLTPTAKADDGKLNICAVDALSRAKIIKFLPKAIKGKHLGLPVVECFHASQIQISSEFPIPLYYDGEVVSKPLKKITIELLPQALELVY